MDERLQTLTEQVLRYRELLALAYAQKDVIQKGDLSEVGTLLAARQELIDRIREVGEALAAAAGDVAPDGAQDAAPADADPQDGARDTERRVLAEAAMLLEKLLSLDKENERLLEVKLAQARGFGRTGYAHTSRVR